VTNEVTRRNAAALERLRALGERLSDEELTREIDPPWTAGGLFAHMAFWDRFTELRWRTTLEQGRTSPAPIEDEPLEYLNVAALPQWIHLPPRAAVEECLAAGAAIDELIAGLGSEAVRQVLESDRPRLVDRSLHRGDHLGTIEAAFAGD